MRVTLFLFATTFSEGAFLGQDRLCHCFACGRRVPGVFLWCGQLFKDFGYFGQRFVHVVTVQSVRDCLDSVLCGLTCLRLQR